METKAKKNAYNWISNLLDQIEKSNIFLLIFVWGTSKSASVLYLNMAYALLYAWFTLIVQIKLVQKVLVSLAFLLLCHIAYKAWGR